MELVPREAILNSMTEGMIIMDPSGAMVSVNPAGLALFGFSSAEEAGQQLPMWSEFLEATRVDGRPIELREWPITRALHGESFTNCVIAIQNRRRGRESWVGSFNANPLRNQNGEMVRIIVTFRNVVDRKLPEQLLNEREGRFRSLADIAPVMIWIAGTDRHCTFVNREWLSFRGRTIEQELGGGWTEGVHRDDLEQLLAVFNSSFDEHRPFTIEYRLRRWDGEYCWILAQGVPQFSSEGTFVGYIRLCRDITEVRMARQNMLSRQNLEAIGLLAGGIAHDFNNLLGTIVAEAELALEDLPVGIGASEGVQKIKMVALRGSEIVRELMTFTGQETGSLELIDIARLAFEMVQMMRISVSKHAHIETVFAANLPLIQANAAQIRQVIMNLVINASEAIGDADGTIRLAIRQDGDFVQIEVADTGCGMDAETRAKIFDPFFTTKHTGRGRGLVVLQAIVRNQSGFIQVETAPGRGTTFRILLPSARVSSTDEPAGAQAFPQSTVKGTILMVEDEPTMLQSVSKMLRRRGFLMVEASDGSAANSLLQDERNAIDVMLLDVTIPGKSSREVFDEARRLRPALKVILTSAYSEELVGSSLNWMLADGFIRKPYQIDSLELLIEQVLNK